MKLKVSFLSVAFAAGFLPVSRGAPLTTVENSTVSVPAANVAAAGIPVATNLSGSNFMLSAVAPSSQRGGNVALASSQSWVNRYNDGTVEPLGTQNYGSAIAVRADGTVVVTGSSSNPSNNTDFVTLCYAADGTPSWTNRYDGPDSLDDNAGFLATTPSGDVWVSGSSERVSGGDYLDDAVIVRYSSNGTPVWTNRYSSFETNNTSPTALAVDSSGNAYLEVDGTVEFALIKYDPLGNILWVKHYLASGTDSGENLCQPGPIVLGSGGNLFVAGTTGSLAIDPVGYSGYNTGVSILKLASDGSEVWTNHVPFAVMNLTRSLLADTNGNLILTGESSSNETPIYVVTKCSNEGVSLWTNTMTGPLYDGGGAPQTVLDPAGNVLLIGGSPGSSLGFYQIEKFNPNGVPVWTNPNADFGSNASIFASAADNSGNLYLVGNSPGPLYGDYGEEDYVTIKYSAQGQAAWTNRFDGAVGLITGGPFAVAVDGAGGVYVLGEWERSYDNFDLTTIKYADRLLYTPPRNFTGSDSISYTLTDVFGNSATGSLAVVVAPGAFGFNPAATKAISAGGFQVQLTGVPGTNPVVLEASTDLAHWQPILTNAPAGGSVQFLDSSPSGLPARFYRAFQQE